jgi:Rrf2 family protein
MKSEIKNKKAKLKNTISFILITFKNLGIKANLYNLNKTILVLFMLKLSKKTEYALLAVKYIALKRDCGCVTAKEISNGYNIPYELLAKILQKLTKKNIVVSYQGIKGGYSLVKDAKDLTLIDVISAIENVQITNCMKENGSKKDCARFDCCQIRDPLSKVQLQIKKILIETTISQIL